MEEMGSKSSSVCLNLLYLLKSAGVGGGGERPQVL